MQLLVIACDHNDPNACAGLGLIYSRGLGVDPDQPKAHSFNERACGLKDERACQRIQP